MSSFPILDLVIGLIFIFFLLSIICSSAVELWLSFRQTRARVLAQWLRAIFNMQALDPHGIPMIGKDGKPVIVGQAIMDHCMITALSERGQSNSYLSAQNFVTALLDKISVADPSIDPTAKLEKAKFGFIPPPEDLAGYIEKIKQSKVISAELQRTILLFAFEAQKAASAAKDFIPPQNTTNTITAQPQSELDLFRGRLEKWYDMNADRLTGTLKRKSLPATIIVAALITIGLNVDTIIISKYLYGNQEVAKSLADNATNSIKRYDERFGSTEAKPDTTLHNTVNQLKQDLDSFKAVVPQSIPLGWTSPMDKWTKHIWGWLATILAITMGAPFWFDILNKIANLRNTGPKPAVADDKKDTK